MVQVEVKVEVVVEVVMVESFLTELMDGVVWMWSPVQVQVFEMLD